MNYFCDVHIQSGKDEEERIFIVLDKESISDSELPKLTKEILLSNNQYKNFAISTSYAKTVNTTNNNYNDNFYIIPELKLNQYLTIKNILSADTVKKRKKAEVVLSVNPFGKKDYDRLRIEFGASETYDEITNSLKNQFKFTTNYRF